MKHVDFQADRSLEPQRNVLDPGPSLNSLLKGKAVGGPLDGAKIQAQFSWDGIVKERVRNTYRSKGDEELKAQYYMRPHPGRYHWHHNPGIWMWYENPPDSKAKGTKKR